MCSLVLVANECNHDFSNLASFTAYFNELLLYDNGLSEKNLSDLRKNFQKTVHVIKMIKNHNIFRDFSKLRNTALESFGAASKQYVLMIDDSYQLVVNNPDIFRRLLTDCAHETKNNSAPMAQIILSKLSTSIGKTEICRLFHRDCRFEGYLNESISPAGGKRIIRTNCFELVDTFEDNTKSKRRNFWYLNHPENYKFFRSRYHLGLYCDASGFYDYAVLHYKKYLDTNSDDKELNFVVLFRLYELTKDQFFLTSALTEYPPRAFEIYYKLGDFERFKSEFEGVDCSKFVYPCRVDFYRNCLRTQTKNLSKESKS